MMNDVAIAIPLLALLLGLCTTLAMTMRNVRRGRTPAELLGHAALFVMATSVLQAVGILGALALITVTNDRPIPIIDRIHWIPGEGLTVLAGACWIMAAMALMRQQRSSAGAQKMQWRRPWLALVLIACIVGALHWTRWEISEIVADARHAVYYENSEIAFRAVTEPEPVHALRSREIRRIELTNSNGDVVGVAIDTQGTAFRWNVFTPDSGAEATLVLPGAVDAAVARDAYRCFIEKNGHVRCLMQGLGGEMTSNDVEGISDVIAIASSLDQACAIERDGRLFCWNVEAQARWAGENRPWKSRLIPDIRAKQVSVAQTHACAIDESGKVYCWGSNRWGELCDGRRIDRTSPAPVVGVSDAVMVAVENSVTCIVRRTGEVACCGTQRRRW